MDPIFLFLNYPFHYYYDNFLMQINDFNSLYIYFYSIFFLSKLTLFFSFSFSKTQKFYQDCSMGNKFYNFKFYLELDLIILLILQLQQQNLYSPCQRFLDLLSYSFYLILLFFLYLTNSITMKAS